MINCNEITGNEDYLDAREIQARIDYLQSELDDLQEAVDDYNENEIDPEPDHTLEELKEELENWQDNWQDNYGQEIKEELENWQDNYGQELKALLGVIDEIPNDGTLIHEDKFTDYVKELCEDCYGMGKELPDWIVIDWEETANNVMVDYGQVDLLGNTYYVRD